MPWENISNILSESVDMMMSCVDLSSWNMRKGNSPGYDELLPFFCGQHYDRCRRHSDPGRPGHAYKNSGGAASSHTVLTTMCPRAFAHAISVMWKVSSLYMMVNAHTCFKSLFRHHVLDEVCLTILFKNHPVSSISHLPLLLYFLDTINHHLTYCIFYLFSMLVLCFFTLEYGCHELGTQSVVYCSVFNT